jgi:heme/copper-type cytochrome/quinol oxidase subunit 2
MKGMKMELSNWWFATLFVVAAVGFLLVVLIVSYRTRQKRSREQRGE